jgi:hypothetical protein
MIQIYFIEFIFPNKLPKYFKIFIFSKYIESTIIKK